MAPGITFTAVWLLLLAVAIAALTKYLAVPYTVALVLVGFGLGFTPAGLHVDLTRDLIFLIFLPPLLFQAAIDIPWKGLRYNLWHVLALAVGGVLVNVLLIGAGAYALVGIPLNAALLFAAIVSATDPVAVVALFRTMGLNRRLTLLIEAESLLNDGIAATVFLVILQAVQGARPAALDSVALFARQALGGVLAGALLGGLMSFLTGRLNDVLIETALTLLLAYGAYLVAEQLHLSGMLAVVAAGLVVGNYGLPNRARPDIRHAIQQFWEFVAFLANSFLFLLIGSKAVSLLLLFHWSRDVLLTLLVFACRAVMVFGLLSLTGWKQEKVPRRWQVVLSWGGLRGAVAIALALGLPDLLPQHEAILGWVYATTLITLVVQGTTMKLLVRWLAIPLAKHEES